MKVDVRGLSCPEPVLMTYEALKQHPGQELVILSDEAHSRKNIENLLKKQKKDYEVKTVGEEFEIHVKA